MSKDIQKKRIKPTFNAIWNELGKHWRNYALLTDKEGISYYISSSSRWNTLLHKHRYFKAHYFGMDREGDIESRTITVYEHNFDSHNFKEAVCYDRKDY